MQRRWRQPAGLERIASNAIVWTALIAVKNGEDAAVAAAQAELSAMPRKSNGFASTDRTAAELVYLNYAHARPLRKL